MTLDGPALVHQAIRDSAEHTRPLTEIAEELRSVAGGGPALRVALYCRISTDNDLQRYSLANQETALRQHAARRGWEEVGVCVDRMSGSRASRPGLDQIVDRLSDGAADAVLVTEQDRLSRFEEIPWAVL